MTVWFWIIAAALLAICAAALLPAMLGRRKLFFAKRSEQTVQAAKNRLTELEADLERQDITQTQFDSARADLESALSDELRLTNDGDSPRAGVKTGAISAMWLAVVPAVALGVYYFVGQPQVIQLAQQSQQQNELQAQQDAQSMDQAVANLEKRLLDNPNDADNWNLLGRSYMSMQEYDEAARAFSRLHKLQPDNLDASTQYAGAMALASGSFNGKPTDLLLAVMEKDPNHPQALWLSAMAARTQGDDATAIEFWTRLLNQPETEQPLREQIQILIAQSGGAPMVASNEPKAEPNNSVPKQPSAASTVEPAQISQASEATGASLEVSVELDPALTANVSPNDTLFIFARAVNGPPMPLAVSKRVAGELPIKITLDDTMGMTPAMKLSSFPNVEVVARISKSGTVMKQAGDMEGGSAEIAMPHNDMVQIRIDRVLP